MSRAVDLALAALLLVGLGEAAWLALRPAPQAPVVFEVVDEVPEVNALRDPSAWSRAVRTRVAQVGDPLTIEDLARVSLAALDGQTPGVAPLSEAERAALRPVVERAQRHRDELLAVEQQLHEEESRWNEAALRILATLTPEQRRWLEEHRDEVSVGKIEADYWEELLRRVDAGAGGAAGSGTAGSGPGPTRPGGGTP